MLPIYSDLLKMWSDLGYNLPITEGKYWLENNFIQAFARDGTLIKLYKYKVLMTCILKSPLMLIKQSIFTPSCGCGGLSKELAVKACKLTSEFVENIKEKYSEKVS